MMVSKRVVFSCPTARLFAVLALLIFCSGAVFAQVPGMGGGNGLNSAMLKLLGTNTAFTARAEFRVLDKNQKEADFMPATYAFLDGKTRAEIDMSQVKSADMPAQFLSTIKQYNMDQTVIITRPDQKLTYSIFPRAKSYAQIPMTKEEIAATDTSFKLDKSNLGNESIDGHPCSKDKVTLTGGHNQKSEAIVWSATDLKDFPVQMQMAADTNTTVIIRFKDVKLVQPDAKQFEAPAGMTKYDSSDALRDALTKPPASAAVKK